MYSTIAVLITIFLAEISSVGATQELTPQPNNAVAANSQPVAAVAPTNLPKIDPDLLESVKHSNNLWVFVRLSNQPQKGIIAGVRETFRSRREMAQKRYFEVASRSNAQSAELRNAQAELDGVELEFRRSAAEQIQNAIRPDQDAMEKKLKALGATDIRQYRILNLLSARIPAAAVDQLRDDPDVALVSPIHILHSQIANSVRTLGAPSFWSLGTGISGIGQSVAILDTGVNAHPALQAPIYQYNYISSNLFDCILGGDGLTAADLDGHGTHLAGIIGSNGTPLYPNYLGVAFGVSGIYSMKVACKTQEVVPGFFQSAYADNDVLQGIEAVVLLTPAFVVNFSAGGFVSADDSFLNQQIDQLVELYGLTMVVSAGNQGPNPYTVTSPGTAYNIISVGAMSDNGTLSRSDDSIANYSSRGPSYAGRAKPDVVAPGSHDTAGLNGIWSLDYAAPDFVQMSGTSMAAPHITGAALLLRQAGITNPLTLKSLLINTTDTLNWAPDLGWGYANLSRAATELTDTNSGSLVPGQFQFYRGTSPGLLYSTLTWNRAVLSTSWYLSTLGLYLYDAASGNLLGSAVSPIDNVQKAWANDSGTVVVKIKNVVSASSAPEPFGLASSAPVSGFSGPSLAVSCTGSSQVSSGVPVTITCTIRNNGDAPAFGVTGSATLNGAAVGQVQSFGTLQPGSSGAGSWSFTAPSLGTSTVQVTAVSSTYGETFTATGAVSFTVAPPLPSVVIDSPLRGSSVSGSVTVSGWAIDNTTTSGTAISSVQVVIDGNAVGQAVYGVSRPDVCTAYPGRPGCPNVGFNYQLNATSLSPGQHTITVLATDTDGTPDVGSASVTVTVTGVPPTVHIDAPSAGSVLSGIATISGWALDNTSAVGTAISNVQVKVDGIAVGNATYGISRPDVCNAYPGRIGCPNVGFSYPLNIAGLSAGSHTITVSATDADGTPDIGSTSVTVTVANGPPTVYVDSATSGMVVSGMVTVSGWALDNTSATGTPINNVQVRVDGVVMGMANYGISRPDVCNAYTGRPGCPNVGFAFALNTATLSPGSHLLMVTATDSDTSPDTGSWSVTIQVAAPPNVHIDAPATGSTVSGTVTVAGWAIDNVSTVGTAISSVQVKVDGAVVGTAIYGASRPDVCAVYPGRASCPNVGYSYSLNTTGLTPGAHTITVMATDTDGSPDVGSATITVSVAASPPSVNIDLPANGATVSGTVTVAGWAIDNVSTVGTAISTVQVTIDGAVVGTATYGAGRPDVCAVFPGRPGCPNVGYTYQLNAAALSAGTHTLTVVASDSDGSPDSGSATITIVR
jgi:hypothetical protein